MVRYLIGRRLVNYGDVDSKSNSTVNSWVEIGTQTEAIPDNALVALAT